MYIHAIVGLMVLHRLIFVASTPLPDVRGNVHPPLSGDLSSSDGSSSSTWTPPSVDVGNSIQMKDQDSNQAPPTDGQNARRASNVLFGSVDSSMGQSRSTLSYDEGNQLQRQEQAAVRQAPSGGWKEKGPIQ